MTSPSSIVGSLHWGSAHPTIAQNGAFPPTFPNTSPVT